MNDCPNADIRDLLPDLVHGRLDAGVRSTVDRHVAGCSDCAAEVALLRDLRATLRRAPALDLSAIAAAVPAYRAPAKRSWVGWRTAAAITMVVAGGSSLLLLREKVGPDTVAIGHMPAPALGADVTVASTPPDSSPLAVGAEPVVSPAGQSTARPAAQRPAVAEAGELAMAGGSLGDLSDRELADLLKDIESLDALPTVDVEQAVVSPILARRAP